MAQCGSETGDMGTSRPVLTQGVVGIMSTKTPLHTEAVTLTFDAVQVCLVSSKSR